MGNQESRNTGTSSIPDYEPHSTRTDNTHRKPGIPLWLIVLESIVILIIVAYIYQAYLFAFGGKHHAWASGEGSRDARLRMRVYYPSKVPVEEEGKRGSPLSVWLWYDLPVVTSTTTSSVTATTPFTPPVTYTVRFEPFDDGILFTDEEGAPTAPEVRIAPENSPGKPGVLYLRLASLKEDGGIPPGFSTVDVVVENDSEPGVNLLQPLALQIERENRPIAMLRRLVELLLVPATVLGLLGLGFQQWTKEQEKREKYRMALLSRIKRILPMQDVGEAVWQWWKYYRKTETKPEWQTPELVEAVGQVWETRSKQEWRMGLLKKAERHLKKSETDLAKESVRLIYRIDPNDRSHETLAARLLAAHMGEGEVVETAAEVGVEDAVDALLSLRQRGKFGGDGGEIDRMLVDVMAGLAGNRKTVGGFYAAFGSNPDGRALLKSKPRFKKSLQSLMQGLMEERETEDVKGIAIDPAYYPVSKLLDVTVAPDPYRSLLWREKRPVESPLMMEWLYSVGMIYNPFGPERAEQEALLPDHNVYPSAIKPTYGPLRGPRHAVLFGAEGSGKTAAALLLAYDCICPVTREKGAFPVYYKPPSVLPKKGAGRLTPAAQPELAAEKLGEALVGFLALKPRSFLNLDGRHKFAVAGILRRTLKRGDGAPGDLEMLFKRAGLSQEEIAQHMLDELKAMVDTSPGPDEAGWPEMLYARPVDFEYTYLLVDMSWDAQHKGKPKKGDNSVRGVQALIGLMDALQEKGVYLKLFLPDLMQPYLDIPGNVTVETLEWTDEELGKLLQGRILGAGLGEVEGMAHLFASGIRVPDPADKLVKAAKGSPRELVRKGNRLIEKHVFGEKWSYGNPLIGGNLLDELENL